MSNHKRWLCVVLFGCLLCIAGCTPTPELISESTPEPYHVGTAKAWIDLNQDGIRSEDEPPLPDVSYIISDTLNHTWAGGGLGDIYGDAWVSLDWSYSPSTIAPLEISPNTPEGYKLTTQLTRTVTTKDEHAEYAFGFSQLLGMPTITPHPPAPVCTSYVFGKAGYYNVTDVQAAPDGTVWVATYGNGVEHYSPVTDAWVHHDIADGLVHNEVRQITITNDNIVWFATDQGVSRFDGINWTSYISATAEGLVHENVYGISVYDNDVWFATQMGASHLDTETGTWVNYTLANGLSDDFLHEVAVMPDGSVWFFSLLEGISRMYPAESQSEEPTWQYYDYNHSYVDDIALAPDGTYWMAASIHGVFHYLPEEDNLEQLWLTTEALAVDPDGKVWVANNNHMNIGIIYRLSPESQGFDLNPAEYYDIQHDHIIPPEYMNDRDDGIYSMTFATDGALWLSSRMAVSRCVFP